jgi:hypothetical protein
MTSLESRISKNYNSKDLRNNFQSNENGVPIRREPIFTNSRNTGLLKGSITEPDRKELLKSRMMLNKHLLEKSK